MISLKVSIANNATHQTCTLYTKENHLRIYLGHQDIGIVPYLFIYCTSVAKHHIKSVITFSETSKRGAKNEIFQFNRIFG